MCPQDSKELELIFVSFLLLSLFCRPRVIFFAAVNGSTQTKTVASSHQGNIDLVIGKLPSRQEILASKTMGKLINFLFFFCNLYVRVEIKREDFALVDRKQWMSN